MKESLQIEFINSKDKCKCVYIFVEFDFNKYVLVKDLFEDVY